MYPYQIINISCLHKSQKAKDWDVPCRLLHGITFDNQCMPKEALKVACNTASSNNQAETQINTLEPEAKHRGQGVNQSWQIPPWGGGSSTQYTSFGREMLGVFWGCCWQKGMAGTSSVEQVMSKLHVDTKPCQRLCACFGPLLCRVCLIWALLLEDSRFVDCNHPCSSFLFGLQALLVFGCSLYYWAGHAVNFGGDLLEQDCFQLTDAYSIVATDGQHECGEQESNSHEGVCKLGGALHLPHGHMCLLTERSHPRGHHDQTYLQRCAFLERMSYRNIFTQT